VIAYVRPAILDNENGRVGGAILRRTLNATTAGYATFLATPGVRVAALGFVCAALCLLMTRSAQAAGPTGSVAFIGSDGGVYTASVAGGSATELWSPTGSGSTSEPEWSHDSTALVFIGADGNVWTVSAQGKNAHALTQQAVAPSGCGPDVCTSKGTRADSPRWSPDGKTISYRLVSDAASAAIYTISANGGTPRQIATADGLCIFNEGFSPNGAPLFSRCAPAGGDTNETYEAAEQPPSGLLGGSQIAYSSGGNRLAFARQTQSGSSIDVALYVAAADGSGATLVAHGGQDPVWSASGLLAYSVNSSNGPQIHVYNATSGADTAVAAGMLAGWSADGNYLVYSTIDDNGDAHIMRQLASADSSTATEIAAGITPALSLS
jgi:Tol biopolymer transport system component